MQPATPTARITRITRSIVVAGLLAGVLSSAMLVWSSSTALFSGTTSTPTNSWAAAAVSLSDDDSTTAMFTVPSVIPGDSGTKCILVTYTGSIAATVKLYAALSGSGLGSYLDVVVDQGNGGSSSTCTGFVSETSTGSSTMAAFAAARTDYATGFGTWAPTANLQTRTYRVAWSMRSDNAAVSKTAGLILTWEARG